MLIEFKVKNYRSIREEQTFSLAASNSVKDLNSCVIQRDLPGMPGLNFLRGAAVYGANASGKSNLLAAIRFLGEFVKRSATKIGPGENIGVTPFKLDDHSTAEPSEFEITFIAEEVRYLYRVAVTNKRVVSESVTAYPKGTSQRWYQREYDEESKSYLWKRPSTHFKYDKNLQDKTRENSLFLSVAPQFNHAQLTVVYNWFKYNLRFLDLGVDRTLSPTITAEMVMEKKNQSHILNLLQSADIGISNMNISTIAVALSELKHLPKDMLDELSSEEIQKLEIQLKHKGSTKSDIGLDFQTEESAGTRRFFSLLGPWTDTLKNGYTVFIDEIETSLHPILVRKLLELLFCDDDAPINAQIVFTTHNPYLLDTALMRRDMIWFTEKNQEGATHLYPLTDYAPRKDEALAKGYLAGRYGAIPYLPEGLKF